MQHALTSKRISRHPVRRVHGSGALRRVRRAGRRGRRGHERAGRSRRGGGRPGRQRDRRARRQPRVHRAVDAGSRGDGGRRAESSPRSVDPLPRHGARGGAAMVQRRSGKILVVGSASALRGMRGLLLARRAAPSSPTCRRWAWSRAAQRPGERDRAELRRQPDLLSRRGRPTRASRSAWRVKCRWAGWSRRARTRCSRPTCAAPRPTASSGRCSRSAAAGSRAE